LLAGISIDDLDGEAEVTTGDQSVFTGVDPQLVTVTNKQEAANAICSWIKGLLGAREEAYGSHEICVAPPSSELIQALSAVDIPLLELKARQKDPGKGEPGVRYGTKKRIKGLEFKAVALTLNGDTTEKLDRFEDYVAATRAQQQLLVVNIVPAE
jgi:hypothetical protein